VSSADAAMNPPSPTHANISFPMSAAIQIIVFGEFHETNAGALGSCGSIGISR